MSIEFDCGEKRKRWDTYLDNATKVQSGPSGKLNMATDTPTLIQRQDQVEAESLVKRSKQKPRSAQIENSSIRAVVSALENSFDHYVVRPHQQISFSCIL